MFKATALSEPVLVGRERELELLQRHLDSAMAGKGATVFVSGEAGSGKTRLSNEFINNAKRNDVTVLSGWCLSNAAVPYFPFIEAFGSYTSDNEPAQSNQLNLITTSLQGTSQAEKQKVYENFKASSLKDQTFSAVTKELLFLSTNKPVILFIDDIHWADSASLALLHYIARAINSERILVIATYRSEEIQMKRVEDQPHPLTVTLRLMGREGIFTEFTLRGLSETDIGKIAENMLNGNVDRNLVEQLAKDSGGNPLSVVESLRMLHEQGSLLKEQNQWVLTVDKIGIPSKVKDVIQRRLDALKPAQRRVLDAASVLGEKFNPELVAHAISQENLDVLDALEVIEQSGRLVLCEGNYCRFDHAKIREMLYDEIQPLKKKELHMRIAKTMEVRGEDDKQFSASDIAYHYIQAGNKEKSVGYSLIAAKDALTKFSNAEAIRYFTYVLDNLPEKENSIEQKMAALEGLGDAFYASMMFKEAANTYETLANTLGSNRLRALRKAMEAYFFQNDLFHLEELLKEADKRESTDRLENARILHNRARVFTLKGNIGSGVEYTRQALEIFEEECSLWDTAWTLIALGSTLPHLNQVQDGLAALFRSIAIFRELKDYRWLIEATNYAGMFLGLFCGLKAEGRELIEKAIKINETERICDYLRLSQSNSMIAWMMPPDEVESAISTSLKALSYAIKTDSYWAKGMAYSNLTMYYASLEDGEHAQEYFGKLMQLPPEVRLNAMVNAPLATAYFLASQKQWEQSMKVFASMIAHFKANPNPGTEAIVKAAYAWALSKQGQFEEAQEQFEESQAFFREKAKQFEHVNIYANLIAPARVAHDQDFEVRLDMVNVSKSNGTLIAVENMIPPELRLMSTQTGSFVQDDIVKFKNSKLEPFETSTLKLRLRPRKCGVFKLNPLVQYLSEEGEVRIAKPKAKTVNVAANLETATQTAVQIEKPAVKFESRTSQRVFDFLENAFREDYTQHRLTQEQSGWRTLMAIARETEVSKNSLYGSSGKSGQVIAVLERQGLIETRLFQGERGRGGQIIKVRVKKQ